jgi:hypothetical protein
MNATTTHTPPGFLITRRTRVKGYLAIANPFHRSNRRCLNNEGFQFMFGLQEVADFLHLTRSVSIEFITGVFAVLPVFHDKPISIPENSVNWTKPFPRWLPVKPVFAVVQKEIVLTLKETHCFVVSHFCLENGRDFVNKKESIQNVCCSRFNSGCS